MSHLAWVLCVSPGLGGEHMSAAVALQKAACSPPSGKCFCWKKIFFESFVYFDSWHMSGPIQLSGSQIMSKVKRQNMCTLPEIQLTLKLPHDVSPLQGASQSESEN